MIKCCDSRVVNKRAYENLARAGAFDNLLPNRAQTYASAAILQSIGSRAAEERNSAQNNLFGDVEEAMAEPDLPIVSGWGEVEQLDEELSAIGFYLSGHPLEPQLEHLKRRNTKMCEDIDNEYARGSRVLRMAGVLHKKQERLSQRTKKRFAYLNFSDPTGEYETFAGEELLGAYREYLVPGSMLELQVKLDARDGEVRLTTQSIKPLGEPGAAPSLAGLNVYLDNESAMDALKRCIAGLESAPAQSKGKMNIFVPIGSDREISLKLPGQYSLDGSFQAALKALPGVQKIKTY